LFSIGSSVASALVDCKLYIAQNKNSLLLILLWFFK